MRLLTNRQLRRLPDRLPVGTTYVVEGYGGEEGDLRVVSRYLVLPGGRRINVPADLSQPAPPRVFARRRNPDPKPSQVKIGSASRHKKIAAGGGTA